MYPWQCESLEMNDFLLCFVFDDNEKIVYHKNCEVNIYTLITICFKNFPHGLSKLFIYLFIINEIIKAKDILAVCNIDNYFEKMEVVYERSNREEFKKITELM